MEFASYMLTRAWTWVADKGLTIAALIILLVLLPRVRRFVIAVFTRNLDEQAKEENKGRRALVGAIVYTVEVVLYFVVALALLKTMGISIGAAVVPATAISAAVGFGAQSVIGDIIGGIFIIIEKQYGIGDWVEFHSPSGTVQGDVVNLTLRATTIRTLNGEAVIVPNAEARMCVNYSSKWSRAVVEAPVPIVHGSSVAEIQERTLDAAQDALSREGIREHILSDLSLQPATALNPPTTLGMPWTVTMRLIVDCDPGDQWLIEREILSTVIDTFWSEYGESLPEGLAKDAAEAGLSGPAAASHAAGVVQADARRDDASGAPKGTAARAGATATADTSGPGAATRVERDDAPTEIIDAETLELAEAERRRNDLPSAGAAIDAAERRDEELRQTISDIGRDPGELDGEDDLPRRQKARKVLSAGGRARPSTVVLIVLLLILGVVNVLTYEPGEDSDGVAGWLAPSRLTSRDAEESPEEEAPATGSGKEQKPADEQRRDNTTTGDRNTGQRPAETRPDRGTGSNGQDTGRTGDSGAGTGNGSGTSGTGPGTGDSGTGAGSGDSGTGTGGSGRGDSGTGNSGAASGAPAAGPRNYPAAPAASGGPATMRHAAGAIGAAAASHQPLD